MTLSKKQRGYHTKRDKWKQCHTSYIENPDPATTRIWPGSNSRVPRCSTRRNSLPVPPLISNLNSNLTDWQRAEIDKLQTSTGCCWWDPAAPASDTIRSRLEVRWVDCRAGQGSSVRRDLSELRQIHCVRCCYRRASPAAKQQRSIQSLSQISTMSASHYTVKTLRVVRTGKFSWLWIYLLDTVSNGPTRLIGVPTTPSLPH